MAILHANTSDAQDILALQKLAYQTEAAIYDDYGIPPLTQTLENLLAQFSDHTFLKAVINVCLVGSVRARCQENTCYIGRLIVHPDFQNQGIGSRLLENIETRLPADRYELFTGSKSERNLYLYKKHGYSQFRTQAETDKVNIIFLQKSKP